MAAAIPVVVVTSGPVFAGPATPHTLVTEVNTVQLSTTNHTAGVTISTDGLTATADGSGSGGSQRSGRADIQLTGKCFWSFQQTAFPGGDESAAPCLFDSAWDFTQATSPIGVPGNTVNSLAVWNDLGIFWNNQQFSALTYPANTIVDMAIDVTAERIWIRGNGGPWNGDPSANPMYGTGGIDISFLPQPWYPGFYLYYQGSAPYNSLTVNFGAQSFAYAPPAGFVPLDTLQVLPGPATPIMVVGNSTTTVNAFTMPAVGSGIGVQTNGAIEGAHVGMNVQVAIAGTMEITYMNSPDNQIYMFFNNGSSGNAAQGTNIPAGSAVSSPNSSTVFPGPPIPMMVVTGRPVLSGPATPVA